MNTNQIVLTEEQLAELLKESWLDGYDTGLLSHQYKNRAASTFVANKLPTVIEKANTNEN